MSFTLFLTVYFLCGGLGYVAGKYIPCRISMTLAALAWLGWLVGVLLPVPALAIVSQCLWGAACCAAWRHLHGGARERGDAGAG